MAVSRASLSGLTSVRAIKFRSALALSAYISGGTVTTSGIYTIHSFTNVGNNNFSVFADNPLVEYLVVAGGGQGGISGSTYAQGGGGAGGYRTGNINLSRGSNQTLTVGIGGTGAASTNAPGAQGQASILSNITSVGGGGGGSSTQGQGSSSDFASSGGSGGGGGGTRGGQNAGAAGTAGQGFAGGNGNWTSRFPNDVDVTFGGGGGGALSAGGSAAPNAAAGGGGTPAPNSITNPGGPAIAYASGAPGNGGYINSNWGTAGPNTANRGHGGFAASGPGSSGIVVIRYITPV